MGFLPCAGRGPGRRGGAVAGGWLVVQAHSVRMGFLPCAGRGPGGVAGPLRVGGWWFRPIRCAWGSFLVLVVALAGVAGPLRVGGWWFRPIRCAWGSFLVLVVALAGVAGPLRVGGWWFRPIRCAWGSFLVLVVALAAGRCGWVVGGSGPFGAHGVPSLCWCRWRMGGGQAHSVRMALLPCAARGPGRRGGAVAGGWLVVQAHSVRICVSLLLSGPVRGL